MPWSRDAEQPRTSTVGPSVVEAAAAATAGRTSTADRIRASADARLRHRSLRAFTQVDVATPLQEAERAHRLCEDQELPLRGVVPAVQDDIDTPGFITTAGSPADGGNSDNAVRGRARPPLRPERTIGGGSVDSATAVMVSTAPGSVTSCSARVPAALCGLGGIRPITGADSVKSALPVSWTRRPSRLLTRCVDDATLRALPGTPATITSEVLRGLRPAAPADVGVQIVGNDRLNDIQAAVTASGMPIPWYGTPVGIDRCLRAHRPSLRFSGISARETGYDVAGPAEHGIPRSGTKTRQPSRHTLTSHRVACLPHGTRTDSSSPRRR